MDQKTSAWLTHIKKTGDQEGTFFSQGKDGTPIIIEWKKRNAFDSDFYDVLKDVGTISIDSFAKVEVDFLRAYPEVALQDEHFKLVAPLFENGVQQVDWKSVEEKIRSTIENIYSMDCSGFGKETTFIFVLVKDKKSGEQFGSAQFFVEPSYAYGDIRLTSIAVKPEKQGRGYGKMLMSSILKIVPEVKRIFLSTRITNENAIKAYQHWGFTKDLQPAPGHFIFTEHWIHLEYNVDQSDILQKSA